MADVRVVTTTGAETVLTGAVTEDFKTKLRGELLLPGDAGYDEARRIWNAMIDKRPALIACCAGVADVMHAVEFARTHNVLLSVRGGGGNFGIVTSFEYRLHSVGPVLAGLMLYPAEKVKEALRLYRDLCSTQPDEANLNGFLFTSPDGVPLVGIAACYNGPIEAGEKILRPLRKFGPPLEDQLRPGAYAEIQSLVGSMNPPGRRYYIKSSFMKTISDEAIDTLIAHFMTVPSPLTSVFFQSLGNAANRVGATETAFSYREALCEGACMASWLDPAADEVNIRWTRELWEAMRPFTLGGGYVNQMGLEAEEGTDRIKAAYGPNYQRLVALKNTYDPTNLFRHNQNIKPTVK